MSNGINRVIFCLIVLNDPALSNAHTLFTNDPGLLTINQSDASLIRSKSNNGRDSINGLASLPGESQFLYGVANFVGSLGRLARIDTETGLQTDLPLFSTTSVDLVRPFARGIAISPLNPNVAIVSGFDIGQRFDPFLWKVDVTDGSVLGPAIPTSKGLAALTYSLDGETLFATTSNEGFLVTVNPGDGSITTIGDPGLSNFIEGIAFRPSDGALFAIDGFKTDELVILDPINGSLVQKVGRLTFGGTKGLAFVIPEPATHLMMLVGVFIVGLFYPRR